MEMKKSTDKLICGICGGIAEKYNTSANYVRIGFVLAQVLCCLPMWIVYLVLYFVMPDPEENA